MFYGITNYCKMLKHATLLLSFTLISTTSIAGTPSVNVYLKLKPDNEVRELIKEFNQFLEKEDIFTTYQITPYLNNTPLHVTLYTAQYQNNQIPKIIKEAESLAKQQQKPVSLLTTRFIPSGGYVMLSVTNDPQIQGLSNKALIALAPFRDKKALIPAWAAQDIDRKMIFNQYGSPAVLNYYSPHFSVFTAENLKVDESQRLQQQLKQLIHKFAKNHQTQIRVSAFAIGVGIVNEQGQIVKELKSFNLE